MQSDSEESLLSAAITDISLKSIQINGDEVVIIHVLTCYLKLIVARHEVTLT